MRRCQFHFAKNEEKRKEVIKTIAVDDGQKLNLSAPRFSIILLQIDLQD